MAARLQMEQVAVQVQEKTEVNQLGFCVVTRAKTGRGSRLAKGQRRSKPRVLGEQARSGPRLRR